MKMFKLEEQKLKDLGAIITTNEIKQQPELWLETYEIYKSNKEKLSRFIDTIIIMGSLELYLQVLELQLT